MASKEEGTRKPVKRVVRRRKVSQDPVSDSLSVVWSYIWADVLIPALKDMLFEGVTEGANHLIYREGMGPRGSSIRKRRGHTNYNAASKPTFSKRDRKRMTVSNIVCYTRAEDQDILKDLHAAIEKYEVLSVAEFYDAAGITSSFADENWGWYSLRGAAVVHSGLGYALRLPDPEPLD